MAERAAPAPAAWPNDADRIFLALATLAALLVRFYRLGHQSLWVDESFTWELIAPGRGLRFWPQILAAYQGPLYHALAWVAVRLDPTVAALRVTSALAGVAAVPVTGLLAGRLFGGTSGRLAALLLAASPFHVWYSQEGRGYALLVLFAAASGLIFLRLLDGPRRWRDALGLAALVAGGLTSNLTFVFMLGAFGLTVLVWAPPRRGRDWAMWAVGLGGGVVLAAPWLLEASGIWAVDRVLPGADLGESLRGGTTFTPWALPFSAFSLLYGFSLGPSLAQLHQPDRVAILRHDAPIILLGGAIAAVALLSGLRGLEGRRRVVVVWVLVPLAGVVLLAVRNVKPFNVRYVATVLPFVLALAAYGITRLRRPLNLALGQAMLLVFVISLAHYHFDNRYAKADLRSAVAHIAARGESGLPILAPNVAPVVRFYDQGAHAVIGCGNEPTVTDAAHADDLVVRELAGQPAAWVVWSHTWHLDPQGLLPAALARQGTLRRTYEGPGVSVDLWRRAAPAKDAS